MTATLTWTGRERSAHTVGREPVVWSKKKKAKRSLNRFSVVKVIGCITNTFDTSNIWDCFKNIPMAKFNASYHFAT